MNKFALTTIAALPQAGGQASSLPAEVGKPSPWIAEMRRRQASYDNLTNVCGVQMRAQYFDWEAETPLPRIDLGMIGGTGA